MGGSLWCDLQLHDMKVSESACVLSGRKREISKARVISPCQGLGFGEKKRDFLAAHTFYRKLLRSCGRSFWGTGAPLGLPLGFHFQESLSFAMTLVQQFSFCGHLLRRYGRVPNWQLQTFDEPYHVGKIKGWKLGMWFGSVKSTPSSKDTIWSSLFKFHKLLWSLTEVTLEPGSFA